MNLRKISIILAICFSISLFVTPFLYSDWIQQPSGVTNTLWDVRFPTPICGWVVPGLMDSVLHTTNGGQTWYKQGFNHYNQQYFDFNCLSFLDTLRGWLGGISPVMRTTNGGLTWDSAAPGGPPLGISFVDSLTGWLCGWNGFMGKTHDGGSTWSRESLGVSSSMWDVCFTDSFYGWSVGNNYNDTSHCILATTDGGTTWLTQSYIMFSYYLYGVWFVDRLHGWAVGNGRILATTDGGNQWHWQYTSTNSFLGVHFVDTLHGWVVGTRGTIVATTDGGATWTQQPTPTTYDLRGVWFVDSLRGWAVGDNGTILFTNNGGFSAVENEKGEYPKINQDSSSLILSITPNPTQKSVVFWITSESGKYLGDVEISILDLTGKRIRQERISSHRGKLKNSVSLNWDLKTKQGRIVSNGVYFVIVRTGRKITRGKLIVCN